MGGLGSGRKAKAIVPKTVGALRALHVMSDLGLYQSMLAEAVSIDSSRLHRLLHGASTPSLAEAIRLEEVLDIPPKLWLEKLSDAQD